MCQNWQKWQKKSLDNSQIQSEVSYYLAVIKISEILHYSSDFMKQATAKHKDDERYMKIGTMPVHVCHNQFDMYSCIQYS